MATTASHLSEQRPSIFEIGEVIGRIYEIRSVLGEGAMGQVFEAVDHSLGRRVAIKAGWPELGASLLRNEARALAAFRHPSLVTVHGIGVHREVDYIVMERVYGVSLEAIIGQHIGQGTTQDVAEAVQILIAVAEATAVVHRAGIAHRDIKPANILLTPDRRVVLMDFGLVLPEFEMAEQVFIAGSPPYMAPEALTNTLMAGSGQLVDIYALGVTAYELLTGELPRCADTLPELIVAHQSPARPVLDLRPDVPERLARVVEEMIEPDPGARVQSVEAAAWELRRISEGRRTSPRPPRAPRVLVVDDDPDVARVVSFYVKRALGTATVVIARDGEEALAEVRRTVPDLMLLDLHMPRMNGMEVCMYLRGSGLARNMRIVPLSAGAQEHDYQLLHQLGVEDLIIKGQDLAERIALVVNRLFKPA